MSEVEDQCRSVASAHQDQPNSDGGEREEEDAEFLPGFSSLEDYSKALLGHVTLATKSCNSLPVERDDFDYYSSFPGYLNFCSKMKSRVDRTISRLLRHQQLPCYWPVGEGGGGTGGVASGDDQELEADVEEKFEALVEANDTLLERVTMLLDEAAGLKTREQPVLPVAVQQGTAEVASWNKRRETVREQVGSYKFIHAKNIQRPQLRFKDQVDNSNNPFIPLIRCKPNAKEPLPEIFQKLQNPTTLNAIIENAREWSTSEERFNHPYQFELETFEPTDEQLQLREPQVPGSLEETPLTMVTTLEQLELLKQELMNVKEFAIDLEHHSYRSYLGFVCLMQISTRNHDYIIDTLELRQHMYILLDPFTDPNIVKVLHGADYDVLWLQRDFGLYIVNMFDTGQASRVLGLPKFSLAFLLQYCCNVQADKQFQLADWRIRPLPKELVKYAREDTHYLLYIYDRQRNELNRRGNKQNNLLHAVIDQSRQLCLKKYKKPIFSEDGYLYLYYKHKRQFNIQQLHCLRLLYAWRDNLARTEDESTGYVLPNHMLFQIAEILPREAQGVLACCNPIPTLLRQQLQEVHILVQKARETPPDEPLPQLKTGLTATPGSKDSVKTEVEEVDNEEYSASLVQKVIQPIGPPVAAAQSKLTVFRKCGRPKLGETTRKRLNDIRRTLPDILGQFIEAKFMTPEEVLQRHLLLIDTKEIQPQTPVTPSPVRELQGTVASSSEGTPAGRHGNSEDGRTKQKRKLSVREIGHKDKRRSMEDIDNDETVRKKPRQTFDGDNSPVTGRRSNFRPFQYEGKQFSDFARGSAGHSEMYDPYCSGGHSAARQDRRYSDVPMRSRVHQKGGERSLTYSHHQGGGNGRRPSWPK